jgi:hypothetical protein
MFEAESKIIYSSCFFYLIIRKPGSHEWNKYMAPKPFFPNPRSLEKLLWAFSEISSPNPDLETGNPFPDSHCEHLQGAWQSD